MARGYGRRKIPMALIDDKSTRKTTFKKRKNGLFKKAMELSKLTDCKVMVFVFNEKDSDISEYSTIDPTKMLQMYVEQAVYPHDKYTNDDYDTIGLKPAERKRLGLKPPGKRDVTILPPVLEEMRRNSTAIIDENDKDPKKKRAKPKEVKKPLKKKRLSEDEEEFYQQEGYQQEGYQEGFYKPEGESITNSLSGNSQMGINSTLGLNTPLGISTPLGVDSEPLPDLNRGVYTPPLSESRNDTTTSSGPLLIPTFTLQDPNKTGRLSTVRRAFSSPGFRIGLTPSPGIQTPRSGDDAQAMDSINSYFQTNTGIYSPNLDELLQTTPKG